MSKLSSVISAALLLLSGSAGFAQSEAPKDDEIKVTMPSFWAVTKLEAKQKVYRRFTIGQDKIPNILGLVCPKDKSVFVHLTFYMENLVKMDAVFPSGFDNFEGRFLVNGKSSFSFPGEVINSDVFFDRTPATWQNFDMLLKADKLQLRFGPQPVKVAYEVVPKFSDVMRDFMKQHGDVKAFFESDAMIKDCLRYRGQI